MNKQINSIFFYLLGELVSKGVPFALLPYLTRKLGPEGFGELAYSLSIVAVIMVFISLSQEAATMSYYYRKGKRALKYLVVIGFLINLAMSLLFCFILSFFTSHAIIIVILASLSVVYSFYLAVLQAQLKVRQYIFVQMLYALLVALLTVIFLEFSDSNFVIRRLESLVTAYALVSLPFFLFFVKSLKSIKSGQIKIYTIYILSYGIPLVLHQLGIYVKGQLDRVFIYQQYSKAELGIYSAGVQIAAILPILLIACNKALVPYYYQSLKDNKLTVSMIKKYVLYSLPLSLLPGLIVYFLPVQLYTWFLGDSYSSAKYYTVIYLFGFGMMFPYVLMVNYFFYHGKNFIISTNTLISSICYLILLWLLSSKDIQLVPYALIISNMILIVLFWTRLGYEKEM